MKKNYLYNLLYSVVNLLFPVLTFPYASRILGPAGIGKVQMAVSFAQYFALIATFGIPYYGILEIAKYKNNKQKMSEIFSELSVISFTLSVLISIIYLVIVFNAPFFSNNIQLYVYAAALIVLNFTSIDWLYTGLEEFKIISLRSASVKTLAIVLLYLFVHTKSDFSIYLAILLFSMLGNNIINIILAKSRVDFTFRKPALKVHFTPLFFLFATNMATSMYMILDTVILGFLSDDHSVGLYTAAVKLSKVMIPFVTSFGAIMVPKLSINFFEKNRDITNLLLKQSFHFIAFFSVPVSMGLFLLSPELIEIFSGSQFRQAETSMKILSLLPVIIGFGYFFSLQILVPVGKNRESFIAVFIGMIIGLSLNFILVPSMLDIGASIANVVCEFAVTLLYFYFVGKGYSLPWFTLIRAVTASLVFIPVILFIRSTNLPVLVTAALGVFTCFIAYMLIQHFLFKDELLLKLEQAFADKLKLFYGKREG